MKDKLFELLGMMPFFLMTDGRNIKMNWARILEGIIIAGIVALLTAYMTVDRLKLKFDYLEISNQDLKIQVSKLGDKLDFMQDKVTTIDTLQQERIQRERARVVR